MRDTVIATPESVKTLEDRKIVVPLDKTIERAFNSLIEVAALQNIVEVGRYGGGPGSAEVICVSADQFVELAKARGSSVFKSRGFTSYDMDPNSLVETYWAISEKEPVIISWTKTYSHGYHGEYKITSVDDRNVYFKEIRHFGHIIPWIIIGCVVLYILIVNLK